MVDQPAAGLTDRVVVARIPADRNHYQGLSIDALRQHGVVTRLVDCTDIRVAIAPFRHDAIHIDWLDCFVRPHRPLRRRLVHQLALGSCLLWSRVLRKPVVWTLHNEHPHSGATREWRFWKRMLATSATAVVVHSDAARDHARSIVDSSRIVTTRFGSFLSAIPPNRSERPVVDWAQASGLHVRAVHFGQLRSQKGIDEILAAIRRLRDDRLTTVIAGRAVEPALDQALHRASTHDAGLVWIDRYLNEEELGDLLTSAQLYLAPFASGLTSTTLQIAAEYGLAIVGPRTPLLAEFADRYLYDPSHPNGFDEALGTAISDVVGGRWRPERLEPADWYDITQPIAHAYRSTERSAGSCTATHLPGQQRPQP